MSQEPHISNPVTEAEKQAYLEELKIMEVESDRRERIDNWVKGTTLAIIALAAIASMIFLILSAFKTNS